MIVIQRGKEPDSLLQYRKSNPEACYEELPVKPREDIREQMWKEQCGLCAYCMRHIKTPKDVRIEHYCARHSETGFYNKINTLDYKKMLGVCYGNSLQQGIKKENMTCDAHRGNTVLSINPYDIHSIRKIKYTSDGYITSDDKEIKKDLEETLNLNCRASSLPENRKSVLIQAKRKINDVCKGKKHNTYLAVLRRIYEEYTERRQLTPYCGIIIAWLERQLGIQ
jgi:hypothetical protein